MGPDEDVKEDHRYSNLVTSRKNETRHKRDENGNDDVEQVNV